MPCQRLRVAPIKLMAVMSLASARNSYRISAANGSALAMVHRGALLGRSATNTWPSASPPRPGCRGTSEPDSPSEGSLFQAL